MLDKAVALKPRDAGIYLAAAQFYWRRRRDASACMALHKQASETPRLLWDTSATVRHLCSCETLRLLWDASVPVGHFGYCETLRLLLAQATCVTAPLRRAGLRRSEAGLGPVCDAVLLHGAAQAGDASSPVTSDDRVFLE